MGLEKQSFVAYLMPSDSGDDKGKGKKKVDEEEGEEEVKEAPGKTEEYDWVREYVFRKDPQHSATYFFVWDEEAGTVRYNEVHTKIVLDKIKSQVHPSFSFFVILFLFIDHDELTIPVL